MTQQETGFKACAIAILAFAMISLFWAVVLVFIFFQEGHQLVVRSSNAIVSTGELKVTEIAGSITAVCALVVAAISFWTARSHNRLSVTPLAWISLGDYENQLFVKIQNNGIGPMIIDRVIVRRGSEEKHSVIEWMPDGVSWDTFIQVFEARSIGRDKELIALCLKGDPSGNDFCSVRDECRRELSSLFMEVHFRDAYGRRMPPATRNFNWFNRNL